MIALQCNHKHDQETGATSKPRPVFFRTKPHGFVPTVSGALQCHGGLMFSSGIGNNSIIVTGVQENINMDAAIHILMILGINKNCE